MEGDGALSAEALSKFEEGAGLVFSRWTALQMAVQNEWGGRSSAQKAHQFASDVVAWLAHSTLPRYIDDLEEMLDENMLLSFNTETEDGSLEESGDDSEDEKSNEECQPAMKMDIDTGPQDATTDKLESSTAKNLSEKDIADGWSVVPSRRKRGQNKS
ncbi:uncharacterized protein LOC131034591 isoform X3 [Cryptomeria japonica]|uniref:uncharacterized protein LOC131034591 isoform X3 n=1 Tax=Cryptomeria japonica TaxID=3369 RepID=UPI0027DA282D|nr:uncharacterized protein LOC131034591 isoform X3 [Cryptomeria japonica]